MIISKRLRNTPIHYTLWRAYAASHPCLAFSEWVAMFCGCKYDTRTDTYEFEDEKRFTHFLLRWG